MHSSSLRLLNVAITGVLLCLPPNLDSEHASPTQLLSFCLSLFVPLMTSVLAFQMQESVFDPQSRKMRIKIKQNKMKMKHYMQGKNQCFPGWLGFTDLYNVKESSYFLKAKFKISVFPWKMVLSEVSSLTQKISPVHPTSPQRNLLLNLLNYFNFLLIITMKIL